MILSKHGARSISCGWGYSVLREAALHQAPADSLLQTLHCCLKHTGLMPNYARTPDKSISPLRSSTTEGANNRGCALFCVLYLKCAAPTPAAFALTEAFVNEGAFQLKAWLCILEPAHWESGNAVSCKLAASEYFHRICILWWSLSNCWKETAICRGRGRKQSLKWNWTIRKENEGADLFLVDSPAF